jgi:ribulose-bisphosphate carboxylase small chain
MRLTQGTYSFLPDLTDEQIASQTEYCIDNGWAVSIEHTDDPHPRNTYWDMWDAPMFNLGSARPVMDALAGCRAAHPQRYIKLSAFDSTKGWESVRASFIVQRPSVEPGFRLDRNNGPGRQLHYSLHSYAADRPPGSRYS